MFFFSAHDPIKERKLGLEVEEMRSARPVPPRKALSPESFFQYLPAQEDLSEAEENPYSTQDEALSKNSKLNQRHKPTTDPALQSSALNSRYTQSRMSNHGSLPPTSPPLSPKAKQPGLSEESQLNKRYHGQAPNPPQDLSSDSRLNQRYQKQESELTNGDVQMSDSKLNNRYRKNTNATGEPRTGYRQSSASQIARQASLPILGPSHRALNFQTEFRPVGG